MCLEPDRWEPRGIRNCFATCVARVVVAVAVAVVVAVVVAVSAISADLVCCGYGGAGGGGRGDELPGQGGTMDDDDGVGADGGQGALVDSQVVGDTALGCHLLGELEEGRTNFQ